MSLITEPVYLDMYKTMNIIANFKILNSNPKESENISLIPQKAVFTLGGVNFSF